MKSPEAVAVATCMFLIASAKGVAVASSQRNPLGFVGISLATKDGFLSRALPGGQHMKQKEKLQEELDKYCL